MQQAFPSVPQEVKDRLHQKGFRPYKAEPLPAFLNPHSATYWATNALIVAAGLVGRSYAAKQNSVRLLWSSCVVGVPLFGLISTIKIDGLDDIGEHRKTLQERLEYSPITRRAWERAVKANNEYQSGLRKEIADLESRLGNKV